MARRQTVFRNSKAIAGAALTGFGMFILYEHLAAAVAWLSHVLGANSSEALGVVPAVILASRKSCRPMAAITTAFCRLSSSTCWYHPGHCCWLWPERFCRGIASRTMSTHLQ